MDSTTSTLPGPYERDLENGRPLPISTVEGKAFPEKESTVIHVEEDEPRPRPTAEDAITDDSHQYPSGIALVFIVVALVLSVFLACLDMTIVATAIPRITDEFQRLDEVLWYGSAYFMCFAAFQSTCK